MAPMDAILAVYSKDVAFAHHFVAMCPPPSSENPSGIG